MNTQTRHASQWYNLGDEGRPCDIAKRIVALEFLLPLFFCVAVWDRKKKRVSDDLILLIDPSISTLFSTSSCRAVHAPF